METALAHCCTAELDPLPDAKLALDQVRTVTLGLFQRSLNTAMDHETALFFFELGNPYKIWEPTEPTLSFFDTEVILKETVNQRPLSGS